MSDLPLERIVKHNRLTQRLTTVPIHLNLLHLSKLDSYSVFLFCFFQLPKGEGEMRC